MALAHTKPKKLAYENDEDILASNGKHTSGIGKVSQSVVESSNGRFSNHLLFAIICSKCQYVPETSPKPKICFNVKVPIK